MNRKWLIRAGALALLASLTANVFLVRLWRGRYERQLAQQIWPAGPLQPRAMTGPTNGSGEIILLAGDSRVAEWGLPALTNGTVVNAGQPGATTAQLRLCLPALLDEFHPATVVIQAGVNDLKLTGLRPDLGPTLVAQAADNLSNLVAQCSARRCRVVLLETWPVGKPEFLRRFIWNDAIPGAIVSLNEKLRALHSPANGVWVVDLFQTAGFAPDTKSFRDALHYRSAIYDRLTPALDRELAGTRKE